MGRYLSGTLPAALKAGQVCGQRAGLERSAVLLKQAHVAVADRDQGRGGQGCGRGLGCGQPVEDLGGLDVDLVGGAGVRGGRC